MIAVPISPPIHVFIVNRYSEKRGMPQQAEAAWGIIVGNPQTAATLTELRFPSPGLRAKHATLGKLPH